MKDSIKPNVCLTTYTAWDRTTRWFHWINFMCVLALAALGLAVLNAQLLGVNPEGKILLKTLHVYVGYVFTINLLWRIVWAFIGSPSARWRGFLPFGRGYATSLHQHFKGLRRGETPVYLGHNPLGRLMVTLLLLVLATQAVTGLILAGTDLYMPPIGDEMAEWVTQGDPEKLALLTPGSMAYVDPTSYQEMRSFRGPVVATHLYAFYVLMVAALSHITGVIIAEVREKNALVSAMLSGEKRCSSVPMERQAENLETEE